jgi:hypothetical protein
MTVTAVGTGTPSTSKTFTLTPAAVSDGSGDHFILVGVVSLTSADSATAIASGNVTWDALPFSGPTTIGTYTSTVFKGKVSSSSPQTVTVTTAGSPTIRSVAKEFATSTGYASITLDKTATANKTAGFPSVTPAAAGESYFSFCYAEIGTSAGSTSGFGYYIDPNSNPAAWDTSCGAGAQAPNIGSTDQLTGIAVLFFEAAASLPAAAAPAASARALIPAVPVPPASAAAAAAPLALPADPYGPLLLQDGTPILLQDGTDLLAQGSSTTLALPAAAAASASAHALTPAAVLPPATATAGAAALTAAVPVPAAGATATAYAPTAFLPLPGAQATAAAMAPIPAPLIEAGEATASAAPLLLPAMLPPAAAASASAGPLALVIPAAAATAGAAALTPAALIPPAAATASAGELRLPVATAQATTAAHSLQPSVVIPGALARARAKPLIPPADAELSTGYPSDRLDGRLELMVSGAWTDVTAWAMPDGPQDAQVKSGQAAGAQQPNPASFMALWDNGDGRFSSRNESGPYYGSLRQNTPARVSVASPYGAYLRLESDDSDRAHVADTSALHVTGSIEVRIALRLSDYRACALAALNDGSTGQWSWLLNDDGTVSFWWYDSGGTLRHVDSTAPLPVWAGAVRVTMNAATGTVSQYTSDGIDGTWTLLGTAASGTSGAASSIRSGNSPLIVGWSASAGQQLRGQVYGLRVYNGIAGTVVADAGFSQVSPGATGWTDTAGRAWILDGGAEVSARDYRLYGELSTLNPTAVTGHATVQATVSGRMRRLQAGSAPAADSAIKRAILSTTGALVPPIYWPLEDGAAAGAFGPAIGTNLMTVTSGAPRPAADTSFEASAALPMLNGAVLHAAVPSYSGATGFAVRFLAKLGGTLPATGSVRLLELTTTGACTKIDVLVYPGGAVGFTGYLSSGTQAFSSGALSYPQAAGALGWWSLEAVTSGSAVQYSLAAVSPGALSGNVQSETVTGHGSWGAVTALDVNQDAVLNDTVVGHYSVQSAVTSIFEFGSQLNAWRTELAANRFIRVCGENGITPRVLGSPALTQPMGPQPRGSVWTILRDCANADQGILYEPFDVLGVGFRTLASMQGQAPALTLDFSAGNLPGDLQPADDDMGLVNDVTAAMPDGTIYRVTLDDGSARSVSEPPTGMGTYAGSPPQPINLADATQLPDAAAWYLAVHSADAARYGNVTADFGIPGAPVAAAARVRPGDLVVLANPPEAYQTADIRQLATGFTELLGPGRKLTWDCTPSAPYDSA